MRPAFLKFWCNLIDCKSVLINGVQLFSVVLVCLSMVFISYFLKKLADLEDIFCYLVEIYILSEKI